MKYRWSIHPAQPALAEWLARELKVSALLAQCLLNRGFSEPPAAARFLEPRLKHLADPFLLPNMGAAVDRFFAARDARQPLVIFGDYDVDGVSTTALLLEVFTRLGWQAHRYLPHRMEEGYGLTRDGVENCLAKNPVNLLLAVDCGSTAVETIAWLRTQGVDVIVLDHHQVSDPMPAALALVNPQAANHDSSGPDFCELCSVGLGFKLAHALVKRGRDLNLPEALDFDLKPLLDLVALGTVADLVPLTGENRIFATVGLSRLAQSQRPGVLALRDVAGVRDQVGTYEVGFQLAPRLNAAGRLETADEALQLLMAPDLAAAMPLAQTLNARNQERQNIERGIAEEVIGAVRASFNPERDFVIVEGQLLWHIGVVGIVASRVLQQFYRPTIIFGGDAHAWRGSGRSIEGFDLAAALRECDDLLIRHGGHAMAAGVTIDPTKLNDFRERLNSIARRSLKPEQLQPLLQLDTEVPLRELTLERIEELQRLRPFGQGNRPVQLAVRNVGHQRGLERIGQDKQHVKMWITDGRTTVEALWWNAGEEALPVGRFDLAVVPQVNEYNGRRSVQFKVLDWRRAE